MFIIDFINFIERIIKGIKEDIDFLIIESKSYDTMEKQKKWLKRTKNDRNV